MPMPRSSVSSYVGMKRKADEISPSGIDNNTHHSLESPPAEEQPQSLVSDDYTVADAQPREQDPLIPLETLISFDSSSQFESTQATHADDEQQPARKRVKVAGESGNSSGIARFAATALAGAVIGGMGVFAALVASAPSV
ncbi:hypothetical protein GP486_008994 [Trichoglossum hirsutum]|uniref:Uncharacterized protein n=1 Tax=Trichoglossum hirsutum TaxID=265104 RepID=A0A9P8HTD0_9PEZI|nr:hypothetical protein GP486_008994 [Trichoglossum hirsutum]